MAIESSEPSAKPCFCPSFSGQRNQSIYTYIYIFISLIILPIIYMSNTLYQATQKIEKKQVPLLHLTGFHTNAGIFFWLLQTIECG